MIKWAIANGNWSDGTTWNDGVVPVDGDYVYCNGFVVTLNANITQLNTTISNESNGNITEGGYINLTTNNMVVTLKEIFTSSTYCVGISGNITCTLTADVYGPSTFNSNNTNCAIYSTSSGNTKSITINGNVDNREGFTAFSANGGYLQPTVNGNVSVKHHFITNVYSGRNFTINGNLTTTYNETFWVGAVYGTMNLSISGNITGGMNFKMSALDGTFYIGGNYHYTGDFNINLSNNVIFASPTAEIKYIGPEPNPNWYIVLTQQQLLNRQQYPPEDEVKEGTEYVWGEKVGTYTPDYPPESVVLKDYEYGDSDDRKTGTMVQEVNVEVGCVTPEDVRKDVPLVGMGVVGSLVVPSVDDVREGVVFDNGSVGTLIVQGGGERLRIADFGYYTNAQSDTYIVDLTEQDKPKFAVAEERVLIEMFPDLDLDNIPDKYFDDLFVKYLKYRLIVEYYRTAGINSTFTPSEPTTEIVNYQNVRNEVWLNSANIYLKAWAKKYPESITKPQRILL